MDLNFFNFFAQYLSDAGAEDHLWLPLDPFMLLLLKYFVVFTCIFFWIKLLYEVVMRGFRQRYHHHHRHDQ